MKGKADLILRFSRAQRAVHWLLTVSFFLLTLTGLVLLVPTLSGLGTGGISRLLHRIGAVAFLAVPVCYALFDGRGFKHLIYDSFHFDKDDLRWFAQMPRYVLGHAKNLPPQGRINAGEKLHHATLILMYLVICLSGLALWLGKDLVSASLFGWMLVAHDVAMFVMVLLTIGHLYFALVYGAVGAMVTGYVTRAYANMEHPKWLAQLDAAASRPARKEEQAS